MKTYYFNAVTSQMNEYEIEADNLTSALEQLVKQLVSNNEPFKVYRSYYSSEAKTIPAKLYAKYCVGYSF